jgi:hypothetical protein
VGPDDDVVLALRGRLQEVGHRILELTQGLRRPEPSFLSIDVDVGEVKTAGSDAGEGIEHTQRFGKRGHLVGQSIGGGKTAADRLLLGAECARHLTAQNHVILSKPIPQQTIQASYSPSAPARALSGVNAGNPGDWCWQICPESSSIVSAALPGT